MKQPSPNDTCPEEWAMSQVIAELIVPKLKAFRDYDKVSIPSEQMRTMDEWNTAIQKMIDAFEIELNATRFDVLTEQERTKRQEEGLQLFAKYFTSLWD